MTSPIDVYSQMRPDSHEPVVEDPSLPYMAEATEGEAPSRSAQAATAAASTGRPSMAAHDRNLMAPFVPEEEAEAAPNLMAPVAAQSLFPEQQEAEPHCAASTVPAAEEGYIRLTFRVANGQITVVGARAVPGPVVVEPEIGEGEMAYELTRQRRRLTAGVIPPDAHLVRSMPHPEGEGALAGHHITALGSFEFTARVPKGELNLDVLAELGAVVYRVKGGESMAAAPEGRPASEASGGGDRLRIIAELKGVDLERLPEDVQMELRSALE